MIAIADVEHTLAAGRELKAWWADVEAGRRTVERCVLVPGFPGGSAVHGFFGEARVGESATRVMGYTADYFFDLAGSPGSAAQEAEWLADQAEEFALRYWLRAEAWSLPQPYGPLNPPQPPPILRFLDLNAQASPDLCGMANLQRAFKRRADNAAGEFPTSSAREVIDLRELESTYEWITIERAALDFAITYRVPGSSELSVAVPVPNATTSVFSSDLTVRERRSRAGVVGEFGAGFCPIADASGNPSNGTAEGLCSGLRLQTLVVLETAEVRLRTVTIMRRPQSSAQAERHLLSAHAIHLRDALLGTRAIWQQVNDWLDSPAIPDWIVQGRVV